MIANRGGYIQPLQTLEMPKPLYPDRINSVAQSMAQPVIVAPAIALPPVSEEVKEAAHQEIVNQASAAQPSGFAIPLQAPVVVSAQPAITQPGFIAPAPLIAATSAPLASPTPIATAPAPIVAVAPAVITPPPIVAPAPKVAVMPTPTVSPIPLISKAPDAAIAQAATQAATIAQQPATELSDQTRAILSHVPGNLDKAKPAKSGAVAISHVSPEIKDLLGTKAKEESYESVGLSIKVRRPGLDTNYELNRAYTSLMGGDTDAAIETYKNILSTDSSNQDALFGLAATYHRLGNLNKARPLYGALLKLNPQHREGLNNFLVLVSDESPQDALPELERLETRNPDFSPIPAQIAIVLDKLGFKDEARAKMLRAIDLAPDNMTYKYNLAIMLDHQGRVADATALYRMLIESSLRGEKVPATADAMQRRLNYLSAAATDIARPAMAAVN